MHYFLQIIFSIFDPVQTTDRGKVMHMSPPCKWHRWAQKRSDSQWQASHLHRLDVILLRQLMFWIPDYIVSRYACNMIHLGMTGLSILVMLQMSSTGCYLKTLTWWWAMICDEHWFHLHCTCHSITRLLVLCAIHSLPAIKLMVL